MTIRTRLPVLLLASTLALAACGESDSGGSSGDVSDLSAGKIVAAAKKQLADEEFVSVEGKGKDEKDGTELEVDLGFAGDTAAGTISVSGLDLQLLRADKKAYFKASDEFYRSTSGESAEQIIDLIGGRWVVADPADDNFGDIASFVSKKEFFDQLLSPEGTITKGDEKKVDGVDCVAVENGKGSVFYFDQSDGKPISLVTTDDGSGTLSFTYDEIDEAEAPPADEIVDPATLGS